MEPVAIIREIRRLHHEIDLIIDLNKWEKLNIILDEIIRLCKIAVDLHKKTNINVTAVFNLGTMRYMNAPEEIKTKIDLYNEYVGRIRKKFL